MSDTTSIRLEQVCSMEYYQHSEELPQQVLRDISLQIAPSQVWACIGNSAFELRLLLEIIANARAYQSGKCVLDQRGMMRQKRTILEHVYYIGSTNMLFDNMNVLEYLMFITAKQKGDVVERQKEILQCLIEHEMSYIALSAIHDLSADERALVTLVVAYYTKSSIIVWNLARLQYQKSTIVALSAIVETLKKENRTLIFSAFDYNLVEAIATDIAALQNGRLIYSGSKDDFIEVWDHVSVIIEDYNTEIIKAFLLEVYPSLDIHEREHMLQIWDATHDEHLYNAIFTTLSEGSIFPQKISRHRNCVENAWEEIQLHDL